MILCCETRKGGSYKPSSKRDGLLIGSATTLLALSVKPTLETPHNLLEVQEVLNLGESLLSSFWMRPPLSSVKSGLKMTGHRFPGLHTSREVVNPDTLWPPPMKLSLRRNSLMPYNLSGIWRKSPPNLTRVVLVRLFSHVTHL